MVRRSYSDLSSTVYQGQHSGYELLMIDNASNSIMIREGQYFDTRHPPKLTENEQRAILFRKAIAKTSWDIAALPKRPSLGLEVWQFAQQSILVLVLFVLLASLFTWRAHLHQQQALRLQRSQREVERRAQQVLHVIRDVVMTTDAQGMINFANPQAINLIQQYGYSEYLGKTLSELWPQAEALWNQNIAIEDYERLSPQPPQLLLECPHSPRIFQQSVTAIYQEEEYFGAVWLLHDVTSQAEAQKTIREGVRRYKALFDEASVGHCLFEVSHFEKHDNIALIRVNEAAVRMAEARDQAHLMSDFLRLTGRPDNPFNYYIKQAIAQNLSITEFELPIVTFSGTSRTLWATISLRAGLPGEVLASFIDITEQKNTLKQIREREVFWTKVVEAMPDVVYVAELDDALSKHITYQNRNLGQLLGYRDVLEDDYWITYLDPSELNQLSENLREISELALGQTREVSTRFRRVDGAVRIIKFRDTPLSVNPQGRVEKYIGTARDVTEEIKQQELIVESEKRYRLLAENISDIIWATDIHLNMNFVSASVRQILGYKPDELLNTGINVLFKERDIITFTKQIQRILSSAAHAEGEMQPKISLVKDLNVRHKHGFDIMLEVQASPLWNDSGQLQGVIGICRDVSEARRLERELHLAAEVFKQSNEGILITDKQQRIVKSNAAFTAITGFQEEKVIGLNPGMLVSSPSNHQQFIEAVNETLAVQGYWQGEISYKDASGLERIAWAGVSAVHDKYQTVQSLIIIISDITERKRAEERIRQLAYFDTLTGLANRSQLNERLGCLLQEAKENDLAVPVLFIDLDRFKPINDSMGHPAGDLVLQEVAKRLQSCVKAEDFICRMGGDEFTLALKAMEKHKAARNAKLVAERILAELNRPYRLHGHEVYLSASIGIAIYPDDASSVMELLKNADMAMYHAKDSGRDNLQFFDHSMNQQAVELLALESELRHAKARNQLELYYQPQMDAKSGKACAAEVLLRWHHPTRGMLPPNIFIPILEDTGLIQGVGDWVIEQACQQLARWLREGIELERIAVNVSARQFKQENFLHKVLSAVTTAGLAPHQLELELTESILIDDVEHTLHTLRILREHGIRTAIDDFGTGYSSLNYLKQFPVDILKIDHSFVRGLPSNQDDAQIVHTIIAMAHNLGLGVIAEGVETPEQMAFLVTAQCEEVQGFLFSKPVTAEVFKEFMLSSS